MSRGHTPYGYRIKNGIAVICEEEADRIRKLYEGYLGGLSLTAAAAAVGIQMQHSSVKSLMQNPHLLGDDFYPAIIDRGTYDAFAEERKRREQLYGRNKLQKKTIKARPAPTIFRMGVPEKVFDDPYQQAEYMYSIIESEE